ncbi:glutathione S-transferase [Candidatus Nitrosoglobus terrae]|uniref:Glutathione S-transferase n=1 Tax=Candidatus Nitrosoglobus terrae TaxID=1630141 RepID=A0A1Q2SNF3_9GAMM|nr:glutathione binding-like protein [Candidatus Nitrosoglobus terrae]BAW80633.1 glutathione S-transferase [Candidatus Nitrosoglobus terrae]
MIKLYYKPGACSLAPHIVLEWIQKPYETEAVNLSDPAFLKLNPAGSVPILDTGEGWMLTQAGAVLNYLADRFPEANLGGGGSIRDKAELRRWLSFFTGDLHPSFYPVFAPQRYTTAEDEAALNMAKAAGIKLVHKRYQLLEDHLKGKKYILGDNRSILDAYAFPMLQWGKKVLPEGISHYPNLVRLHDTLAADSAVQKALKKEGLI